MSSQKISITFGETIRNARESKNLLLRELASKLEIDPSLLSKIETNNRLASRELVLKISIILSLNYNELLILWYSDKIFNELKNEKNFKLILELAQKKISDGEY